MYPAIAINEMRLPVDESSWFGSIPLLAAPIGALVTGAVIDKLGRRTALLWSVSPTIVGWLLLWWDHGTVARYAAQALHGVSAGAFGYPSQVYAGECVMINHVAWRSAFLTWLGVTNAFGMFGVLVLGYFWPYRLVAALLAAFAALSWLLIFCFIPESPSWLYIRGRRGDAEWSQLRLGIAQPVLSGGNAVETFGMFTVDADDTLCAWSTVRGQLAKVRREDVYRPVLVMAAFFVVSTLSGGLAIVTYLVDVIDEVSPNDAASGVRSADGRTAVPAAADTYQYTIVSGAIILAANFFMFVSIQRLGVKTILTLSSTLMAVGYAALAYATVRPIFVVHVAAVWLVVFGLNFGVMNLPNAVLGDLFPVDAKGYASVVYVIEFIVTAALIKAHPFLRIELGGYVYGVYAVVSLLTAAFVRYFMVETVGKTLGQINREFLGVK